MSTVNQEAIDRRSQWEPAPRPEWLAQFNKMAEVMNIRSVVPLDEQSLMDEAARNTGLDDFGDGEWLDHFRVLLKCIDEEAELNYFGRLHTRSDFLTYLEGRLNVINAYKQHPEIEDEVIEEPVFILGFGRSGTTILHEVMSKDPQFRTVRRWEGLFPYPPPEKATYETDPRIREAQKQVDMVHTIAPEWESMHAWGASLPVEDIEFTCGAFFSEIWSNVFQIPSYDQYFSQQDPTYHFQWHKKMLKLLQWKYKKKHWLLKNPTHMPRIQYLLRTYPDAKIIFPHRDPIVATDSVVNVSASIFHWRSDKQLAMNAGGEWMVAEAKLKQWNDVIDFIENNTLRKGYFSNVLYADFIKDPIPTLKQTYRDLGLEIDPKAFAKMKAHLDERNRGSQGKTSKYQKTNPNDARGREERRMFKHYQEYFGVPNEV
jgi:hypothetical protein